MDFLVVGPGAMGCLFAARLKKAGHEVNLLDYRQERADLINRQGIHVEGVSGDYQVKVPASVERVEGEPEVVLICVKANQTASTAELLKSWITPHATILTLQNGLGNLETLQSIFGSERVLGGITAEGATLLGPGHIRHAGQGDTVIGPRGSAESPASRIVKAFNQAGFKAKAVPNAEDLIWGKLVINVGINALTAIVRLRNGLLPELEGTRAVMEEAVREAVAVASAKGVDLPYPDPLGRVIEVCRATSSNMASMLQDVLHQRATEVPFINGAIVEQGRTLGIDTPVNYTLTCLVQAIEKTYDQRVG